MFTVLAPTCMRAIHWHCVVLIELIIIGILFPLVSMIMTFSIDTNTLTRCGKDLYYAHSIGTIVHPIIAIVALVLLVKNANERKYRSIYHFGLHLQPLFGNRNFYSNIDPDKGFTDSQVKTHRVRTREIYQHMKSVLRLLSFSKIMIITIIILTILRAVWAGLTIWLATRSICDNLVVNDFGGTADQPLLMPRSSLNALKYWGLIFAAVNIIGLIAQAINVLIIRNIDLGSWDLLSLFKHGLQRHRHFIETRGERWELNEDLTTQEHDLFDVLLNSDTEFDPNGHVVVKQDHTSDSCYDETSSDDDGFGLFKRKDAKRQHGHPRLASIHDHDPFLPRSCHSTRKMQRKRYKMFIRKYKGKNHKYAHSFKLRFEPKNHINPPHRLYFQCTDSPSSSSLSEVDVRVFKRRLRGAKRRYFDKFWDQFRSNLRKRQKWFWGRFPVKKLESIKIVTRELRKQQKLEKKLAKNKRLLESDRFLVANYRDYHRMKRMQQQLIKAKPWLPTEIRFPKDFVPIGPFKPRDFDAMMEKRNELDVNDDEDDDDDDDSSTNGNTRNNNNSKDGRKIKNHSVTINPTGKIINNGPKNDKNNPITNSLDPDWNIRANPYNRYTHHLITEYNENNTSFPYNEDIETYIFDGGNPSSDDYSEEEDYDALDLIYGPLYGPKLPKGGVESLPLILTSVPVTDSLNPALDTAMLEYLHRKAARSRGENPQKLKLLAKADAAPILPQIETGQIKPATRAVMEPEPWRPLIQQEAPQLQPEQLRDNDTKMFYTVDGNPPHPGPYTRSFTVPPSMSSATIDLIKRRHIHPLSPLYKLLREANAQTAQSAKFSGLTLLPTGDVQHSNISNNATTTTTSTNNNNTKSNPLGLELDISLPPVPVGASYSSKPSNQQYSLPTPYTPGLASPGSPNTAPGQIAPIDIFKYYHDTIMEQCSERTADIWVDPYKEEPSSDEENLVIEIHNYLDGDPEKEEIQRLRAELNGLQQTLDKLKDKRMNQMAYQQMLKQAELRPYLPSVRFAKMGFRRKPKDEDYGRLLTIFRKEYLDKMEAMLAKEIRECAPHHRRLVRASEHKLRKDLIQELERDDDVLEDVVKQHRKAIKREEIYDAKMAKRIHHITRGHFDRLEEEEDPFEEEEVSLTSTEEEFDEDDSDFCSSEVDEYDQNGKLIKKKQELTADNFSFDQKFYYEKLDELIRQHDKSDQTTTTATTKTSRHPKLSKAKILQALKDPELAHLFHKTENAALHYTGEFQPLDWDDNELWLFNYDEVNPEMELARQSAKFNLLHPDGAFNANAATSSPNSPKLTLSSINANNDSATLQQKTTPPTTTTTTIASTPHHNAKPSTSSDSTQSKPTTLPTINKQVTLTATNNNNAPLLTASKDIGVGNSNVTITSLDKIRRDNNDNDEDFEEDEDYEYDEDDEDDNENNEKNTSLAQEEHSDVFKIGGDNWNMFNATGDEDDQPTMR